MLTEIKYPTPYKKRRCWHYLDLIFFCTSIVTFFILIGYTWAYKAYSPQITELKREVSRLETKLFTLQIRKEFQDVITK